MATVFNVATVLCPAKLRRKFCAILSCAGFLPESLKFYGFMYPKIGGPKSTYPKWSKMISTLSASELIHSIDTETTKPPTTVFWGYVLGIYIYTYIIIYHIYIGIAFPQTSGPHPGRATAAAVPFEHLHLGALVEAPQEGRLQGRSRAHRHELGDDLIPGRWVPGPKVMSSSSDIYIYNIIYTMLRQIFRYS